jgi:hypothetical protein
VSFGVAAWQRMTGHRMTTVRERNPQRRTKVPKGPKPTEPKRSVMQRLEDRWQRRQDDR